MDKWKITGNKDNKSQHANISHSSVNPRLLIILSRSLKGTNCFKPHEIDQNYQLIRKIINKLKVKNQINEEDEWNMSTITRQMSTTTNQIYILQNNLLITYQEIHMSHFYQKFVLIVLTSQIMKDWRIDHLAPSSEKGILSKVYWFH